MDQTAFEDKIILWYQRKCRKSSNMDCYRYIFAGRNNEKNFKLDQSLYTILQVLSVSLFEKMPILEAFSKDYLLAQNEQDRKQLSLFD